MYIDERLLEILETHKGETVDVIFMISLIKTIAKEHETEQLAMHGVGSSLPKVCKGCGNLSTKVIDKKYLACCPDSNYIPMKEYCKNSIYSEK